VIVNTTSIQQDSVGSMKVLQISITEINEVEREEERFAMEWRKQLINSTNSLPTNKIDEVNWRFLQMSITEINEIEREEERSATEWRKQLVNLTKSLSMNKIAEVK
jgi:hypothetical protein